MRTYLAGGSTWELSGWSPGPAPRPHSTLTAGLWSGAGLHLLNPCHLSESPQALHLFHRDRTRDTGGVRVRACVRQAPSPPQQGHRDPQPSIRLAFLGNPAHPRPISELPDCGWGLETGLESLTLGMRSLGVGLRQRWGCPGVGLSGGQGYLK